KHKNIGVSEKASISATAKLGENCDIHDFVVIADNVKIGSGCTIYPGVYIAEGVTIGNDCIIYPSVTIYDGSIIGERVIINANSTVGEDGFGFATANGSHHKIPQVGIAILEDDVEIGTCCAIERGTLDDTVIGKGSKLGDLIAIGHGTKIGEHCLLVAQVGVAGSARLGNYCVVGGQAGIVGHINIGNGVQIAAQSGVINDVADGKAIFGSPAIEISKARRAYSMIQYLPDIRQSVRKLQKQIDKITSSNNPDSQESNK
ncbi:MAG: UDP-3-O-(3-hydroxymyristoyl)glucosamine N-acyltransferase, partial [Planctomycetes bacterium]|nr:UDP-3-O-(3-hydroxymyristoyl)glucosamine N-acyltransferase [Planctomycetota bacterium]